MLTQNDREDKMKVSKETELSILGEIVGRSDISAELDVGEYREVLLSSGFDVAVIDAVLRDFVEGKIDPKVSGGELLSGAMDLKSLIKAKSLDLEKSLVVMYGAMVVNVPMSFVDYAQSVGCGTLDLYYLDTKFEINDGLLLRVCCSARDSEFMLFDIIMDRRSHGMFSGGKMESYNLLISVNFDRLEGKDCFKPQYSYDRVENFLKDLGNSYCNTNSDEIKKSYRFLQDKIWALSGMVGKGLDGGAGLFGG